MHSPSCLSRAGSRTAFLCTSQSPRGPDMCYWTPIRAGLVMAIAKTLDIGRTTQHLAPLRSQRQTRIQFYPSLSTANKLRYAHHLQAGPAASRRRGRRSKSPVLTSTRTHYPVRPHIVSEPGGCSGRHCCWIQPAQWQSKFAKWDLPLPVPLHSMSMRQEDGPNSTV